MCAPSRFTHNSTFAHSGRHRAREGSPRCHVHPEDAREKGLGEGSLALLENSFGRLTLPVAISPDMPRGMVRVDGLPAGRDLPEGVGVNALISPAKNMTSVPTKITMPRRPLGTTSRRAAG